MSERRAPDPLVVVVVDDDERVVELLGAIIGRRGHHVVQAYDGIEALEAWRAENADVVVTDWRMPGLDGLELARRIRAHPGAYTYVLFVSVIDDEGAVLQALDAGADDYLRKPLEVDDLNGRLLVAERAVALHRERAHYVAELERLTLELRALLALHRDIAAEHGQEQT